MVLIITSIVTKKMQLRRQHLLNTTANILCGRKYANCFNYVHDSSFKGIEIRQSFDSIKRQPNSKKVINDFTQAHSGHFKHLIALNDPKVCGSLTLSALHIH